MDYTQLKQLIEGQGSHFVYVEFLKKDGSLRKMIVQPAATATHVAGPAASESARRGAQTRRENHPNLLNVYDVDQRAIRSINLDTLITVRANGRTLYMQNAKESA